MFNIPSVNVPPSDIHGVAPARMTLGADPAMGDGRLVVTTLALPEREGGTR